MIWVIRSPIGGRDRHHGRIDAGQLADRQALERGQADHAEDDRGDRGEDRAANGKVGKHQPAFCLWPPAPPWGLSSLPPPGLTGAPSCTRFRPSPTIFSPGFRPEVISMKPSAVTPV